MLEKSDAIASVLDDIHKESKLDQAEEKKIDVWLERMSTENNEAIE